MRRFDYSFLDKGLLPSALVNVTADIASLKTMAAVRKNEHLKIFTELEAVAKIQSVKSSNAIEGIVTSGDRIAAIVKGSSAPLNQDEAEIAGYCDALNLIHQNYGTIQFSENDILHLHSVMLNLSGTDFGGKYKTEDNVIKELDKRFAVVNGAKTVRRIENRGCMKQVKETIYAKEEAVNHLLPQKLKDQYALLTEGALKLLKFVEAKKV